MTGDDSKNPLEQQAIEAVAQRPATHPGSSPSVVPLHPQKSAAASGARAQPKAKDTMLACRYELKYRISESKARAIAEYVRAYLEPDRYAKLRPRGEYPITSLYLDSDGFQLARETLEGKKNRFKLRVRGYSDNPQSPCFFEVKRRVSNVILKSRARVQHEDIARILQTARIPAGYKTDEKALKQFLLYVNYLQARPLVLVRYMREAYEGDSDNRVRITFDRQLCYNVTREPIVKLNGTGWQDARLGFVVLEVKFTANYPAWLNRMVRVFDLKQTSMSKYASSVRLSCAAGFCAPQAFGMGAPQLAGYLDG
ncbi:MAG: polyphosphate polymerase domain-containing protein [Phycisphaerae bacterium]|nr:polyphosphate polymerase domain-containing protein [Phycisphaerae bacterium]